MRIILGIHRLQPTKIFCEPWFVNRKIKMKMKRITINDKHDKVGWYYTGFEYRNV